MDCDTLKLSGVPEDYSESTLKAMALKYGSVSSVKVNPSSHATIIKFHNPISTNRAYYGLKDHLPAESMTLEYDALKPPEPEALIPVEAEPTEEVLRPYTYHKEQSLKSLPEELQRNWKLVLLAVFLSMFLLYLVRAAVSLPKKNRARQPKPREIAPKKQKEPIERGKASQKAVKPSAKVVTQRKKV